MRIILVGQAAFAERILTGLVDRGDTVLAVYCPPDRPGAKPDQAKVRAGELGVPVRQYPSLKRPEVAAEFRDFDADLAVLAYVTQIVPEPVIEIPRLGTICFHPSLLPRYRGGSAINWQIINGETRTGVTVFWVDAGIDTGPILLQKETEIDGEATAGSLYYKTLFPLGVEAILEAVTRIDADEAPRLVQDERTATHDPLCRDEHAEVLWNRPARQVYNLIRGCDPQPGAFTRVEGRKVRLYDVVLEPADAGGARSGVTGPGWVVGMSPEGIRIAAEGGVIRIGRVRPDGAGAKVNAAEFGQASGLVVGAKLG